MFKGRGKKVATGVAGCLLLGVASLVAVPLATSAQPSQTSQVSLKVKPPGTTTGKKIEIIAKVTAVTADASTRHALRTPRAATANAKPSGTVVFSITGTPVTTNAQTIDCKAGDTVPIKKSKAVCKVTPGMLQAVQSPYHVVATYSGDDTFTGSVGLALINISVGNTHSKLKVDTKPRSGTGNTFTDKIDGGPGGSLLSGTVTFAVSDTPSQAPSKRKCQGGDVQPVAVTGNVGTATCVLAPGWFIVPGATHQNPHPHGAWNVSATYSGDGNFHSSTGSKSGHSKF